MTRGALLPMPSAILAVAAVVAAVAPHASSHASSHGSSHGAFAEVPRRELASEVDATLELRSGRSVGCSVKAWSGEALEGSCGTYRWEDLAPASALRLLRAMVPAKDARAGADAAAVLLSLPDIGKLARSAEDLARRAGASKEEVAAAKEEAKRLVAARADVDRAARASQLDAALPEGLAFAPAPWPKLDAQGFERAGSASLESARSMLAAAGTSAAVHEQAGIVVLAEQSSDAHREDAVELEKVFRVWAERFGQAGFDFHPQGKIPVVMVGSRDAWRVLLASAASADSSAHPDVLVVYRAAKNDPAAPLQAIVLVAPQGDHLLRRANAAFGVARAMLHYATVAERPPGWLNEGLPRVIADLAVPKARWDATLRTRGLAYLRSGGNFKPVLGLSPGSAQWVGADGELARSLSYLLTRFLYEKNAIALVRIAKPRPQSGANPAAADPFDARFRAAFDGTLEAAAQAACTWYQTND